MIVHILEEAGYTNALLGLSLSFYDHKVPLSKFFDQTKREKIEKLANKLANKKPPEEFEIRNNFEYICAEQKFLEQIDVWIYIQASRDFWSEFDTYRVDVSKQSSSTMHTLSKRYVDVEDFEEGTTLTAIQNLNNCLNLFNDKDSMYFKNVTFLKKNLPEGWLQERVVKISYKTLKWMINQRLGHRLTHWNYFIGEIKSQIAHPTLIFSKENS